MKWIEALGQQAGSTAMQGGFGMGFARLGSRYDRKMNKKLQMQQMGIQMSGQREMMNYQQDKELEMLGKSPLATIEGLKKAGLNPGLMYGMGGDGGTTTGHGGGTGIGGQAPYTDTTPRGMGIESLAQLQLLKAQKENIEADTKLKNAGVPKAGAETENLKAQETLTRVQTEIAQVAASVSRQTMGDQMQAIVNAAQKGVEEVKLMKENVKLVKQQAINAVLEAANIEAKTNLTKEETHAIGERLLQMDRDLDIKDRERQIKEMLAVFQTKHPGIMAVLGGTIESILNTGDKKEAPKVVPINKR